jgi:SecD/SecF fusion protein
MQNKGFVRVIAVSLFLVCLFYLSFSFVTSHYNNKAIEYAKGDAFKHIKYLDSISTEKIWLGYTYKECREKEINLGLDLKGGMNVILEISVPDILRALSNYNDNADFNKALSIAKERQANSQSDFVTLFEQAYKEIDPNGQLSAIFSTFELKDRISLSTRNDKVIAVLREEVNSAIDNSFNVLRQRIDRFGVVQPNIQKLETNGRILIELPGIKEPERVRKLLQGTANLEFWETYELSEIIQSLMAANDILREMNLGGTAQEAKDTVITTSTDKTQTKLDSLANVLGKQTAAKSPTKDELEFKKQNPLFAVLTIYAQNGQVMPGPTVGEAHFSDTATVNSLLKQKQVRELLPRDLALKWEVKPLDEKTQRFRLIAIKVTNRDGRAPLQGDVITNAYSDFGQYSGYANVNMSMNAEGAKIWARLTKENIGRSIAVVLDGYVYSFPRVNDEITGGNSQITGNFTIEEAKDLANTLKSGKMPAPARIVQEDIVGPSLGKEAINAGLISFLIAFLLVLGYMIFFYGLAPGLVSDIALLFNVFMLFGVLASFKAVLTLPGIAGIVLTLGMAVDANVLIYERIREEMRGGKTLKKAIDAGYSNAISAILDSNITTLITGIILFYFGTGPIKGFATTLIIGIISSFLTSVFLTRIIIESFLKKENTTIWKFSTRFTKNWFKNVNFNFIGNRKIGYVISGIIIIASIVSLFTRGLNQGIDFSGGRNYIVRFENNVKTAEVKDLLKGAFDGETVSVITIGADNQVRISTNYKINEQTETIDDEIETRLYDGLKPLLGNTSREDFVKNHIMSSQRVGPTIADDIKTSAIWAILFSIIAIGLYIFVRFRDVSFSVGAITSLIHDVAIVLGLYSILYSIMPFSLEIDQAFIAAILTVIGYSINDTVIIFDRIRENRILYPKRDKLQTINHSLNSTLVRTFNTTFTTSIVLIAIFIFGGEVIRGFIFALLIGIVVGTYSSLFVASSIAYEILSKKEKKALSSNEPKK